MFKEISAARQTGSLVTTLCLAFLLSSCDEPGSDGNLENPLAKLVRGNNEASSISGYLDTASGGSANFPRAAQLLEVGGEVFCFLDVETELTSLAAQLESLTGLLPKSAGTADAANSPGPFSNTSSGAASGILKRLGFANLKAIGLSSSRRKDGFHNRSLLYLPDGPSGIFQVLGSEAAPFTAVSLAPSEADLVAEIDLNLKSLLDLVSGIMGELGFSAAAGQFSALLDHPIAPGIHATWQDLYNHSDTEIAVVGQIDRKKTIGPFEMGIPALPAPELLISIANMAWLADEVVALFPEDQLLRKTGEGFTSFTFAGEIPLAADTVLKPVLYNDTAHGRVLIASHPDFLARCLADGGGVAKHPDFRSANEGIPASGNAFVYLSSDLSSVLKDLNQTQISQMQAQAKTPTAAPAIMPLLAAFQNHPAGQSSASATQVLSDGIYSLSNSARSHKSTAVVAGGSIAAALAAASAPYFMNIAKRDLTPDEDETQTTDPAGTQLALALRVYAYDHYENFPNELKDIVTSGYLPQAANLSWKHPNTGLELPWVYTKGLSLSAPDDLPILRSPKTVNGSFLVIFTDGSCQMLPQEDLEPLRERLGSYLGTR